MRSISGSVLAQFPRSQVGAVLGAPGVRAAAIAAYLAGLLAVDTQVDLGGQLVLGAATWAALLLACCSLPPERRAQAALVVVVATGAELTGSVLWGVYTYRLDNLPTFVPPAHGLVYLCGVSLATALGRHRRALAGAALAGCLGWALAGLTVLPRTDVGGALGAALLTFFLLRGRAPAVYAGVFLVVAALELYGTVIGTWTWAETIPGTGVPNGNPPSGVASGYVWFDVMALTFAPALLALVRRGSRSRGSPAPPLPHPARSV
jgi:hypothetical protein